MPTIKKTMQVFSRIQNQVEHPCHNFISDILFFLKSVSFKVWMAWVHRECWMINFVKVHNLLFYIFYSHDLIQNIGLEKWSACGEKRNLQYKSPTNEIRGGGTILYVYCIMVWRVIPQGKIKFPVGNIFSEWRNLQYLPNVHAMNCLIGQIIGNE